MGQASCRAQRTQLRCLGGLRWFIAWRATVQLTLASRMPDQASQRCVNHSMQIIGPALNERPQCEEILRSLPMWFGIEPALVMYADDSVRLPTFAAVESAKLIGFISLRQHFPH